MSKWRYADRYREKDFMRLFVVNLLTFNIIYTYEEKCF